MTMIRAAHAIAALDAQEADAITHTLARLRLIAPHAFSSARYRTLVRATLTAMQRTPYALNLNALADAKQSDFAADLAGVIRYWDFHRQQFTSPWRPKYLANQPQDSRP